MNTTPMRTFACAAAVLTVTIACRDRKPPAPAPASDAGTRDAIPIAPPLDGAAPGDAEPADAAVARDRLIHDRFAVEVHDGDRLAAIVVYEIVGGAFRQVSRTAVADVFHLAWNDPAAALYVAHGRGAEAGAAKVGEIRDGRYRALSPSGRGDLVALNVGAAGSVWVDRCVHWGDNLEEEGCLRHLHVELPPGDRTAATAPAPPALPAATTGPAGVTLTARILKHRGYDRHLLDCTDERGIHAVLTSDDQVDAAPRWRWLSATPPIALLEISYGVIGEGPARITPKLLRGCKVDEDEAFVQVGPDGLWAERTDRRWTVRVLDATLGEVEGGALVFAGGTPFGGD